VATVYVLILVKQLIVTRGTFVHSSLYIGYSTLLLIMIIHLYAVMLRVINQNITQVFL